MEYPGGFPHSGSLMNDASPILPRTLGETITQEIRRMLVEGELVPGQRLSEAALAENLDISRNTLREAFRVLTREGLLKHEPNRGVTVAEPDMASIIDIYRVRRFIDKVLFFKGKAFYKNKNFGWMVGDGSWKLVQVNFFTLKTSPKQFHPQETSVFQGFLSDCSRWLKFLHSISG